ncbi:MAG: nucleotidyltransferase domain-containing protein [Pseudomonadota bacterium]
MNQRFPDADTVLLSGSVVRGEATETSDLDLVVLFEHLPQAARQSFNFDGWPVEAFLHDLSTLEYFFWDEDRPTGVPSLANMVLEGIEIPTETALGQKAKLRAQRVLDAGPIPLSDEDIDTARYAISDLLSDLRAPRGESERRAILTALYPVLADFLFRSAGKWSAKGKTIPGHLRALDPARSDRFEAAFELGFAQGDARQVLELSNEALAPFGGDLFDGYERSAPHEWRK